MATANVQWAYSALHHLGNASCRGAFAPLTASSRTALPSRSLSTQLMPHAATTALAPNLLVSTAGTAAAPRVLLLARRGNGALAGVELFDQRTPLQATLRPGPTRPSRQAQLSLYLAHRRLQTVGHGSVNDGFRAGQPLLVHSNHLIGYKLGGSPDQAAVPLYAHSLRELASLAARDVKTLNLTTSLLGYRCFEWDHWRQLTQEPGWTLRHGDEAVLTAAIRGHLPVSALPSHTTEIELLES